MYQRYSGFLEKANDPGKNYTTNNLEIPRKVIETPCSSFLCNSFPREDHREEDFRFIGNSDIPSVRNGRGGFYDYKQVLSNWQAMTLPNAELMC